MQFENFITQLADRLPFGISFNVSPDQNWNDKVVVAGFELNRYNDLSVSETWFANIVQELNTKRSSEAQIEIKLLSAKFKDVFSKTETKVDNLADALSLLFKPVELLQEMKSELAIALQEIENESNPVMKTVLEQASEKATERYERYQNILNSDEYADFILAQSESYQKIAELSKLVESDLSIQWLIVTFFLMSRFNGDWSFDHTARLPIATVGEIYEFYVLESNKGVATPDLPGFEQEDEIPDVDAKTKKPLTEDEKEALKLGKS